MKSVAGNTAEMGGQFIYSKKAVWISEENTDFDGKIMTLTFEINAGTEEGDYPVTVTYNSGDIYDSDEIEYDFRIISGGITVTGRVAGDINGDGIVNNKDVTRLVKYLAGEEITVVEASLDVNGDGTVNNKDLTRLIKYLAGVNVEIF